MPYRSNDYVRRPSQPYSRASATPPPHDAHRERDPSRDVALTELFRVREDFGHLRTEVVNQKEQLAESANRITQLTERLKPITDDWDTTASQGDVNSVREQVIAAREDLQDALDRIRQLEDTAKELAEGVAKANQRYDNGGASFKKLQERVAALEANQDATRGPLAARISSSRKTVAKRGKSNSDQRSD